ncbi:endodeoxyribonuclease [Tilletia horrida]|nr:endodeoxyribonuclease [Tilletia horrida]
MVLEQAHLNAVQKAFVTKRDLFYRDVTLFKRQSASDAHIDALADAFGVEREALGFRAGAKGLIAGSIQMRLRCHHKAPSPASDGGSSSPPSPEQAVEQPVLTCTAVSAQLLPSVYDLESIKTDAAWVLIVEKEAVFQLLRQCSFANGYTHGLRPGLIVTGKGYPDQATRQFLLHLASHIPKSTPFFIITDGDPHGIDIYRTYLYGDGTLHKPGRLALQMLQWLGLRSHDFVPSQCQSGHLEISQASHDRDHDQIMTSSSLLPMSEADTKKAQQMLALDWLPNDLK